MPQAATWLASLALCYAGLAALSLTMSRHQEQVLRKRLPPRATVALRLAGWLWLAFSFGCALVGLRASIAAVAWLALFPVAALAIVVLLPYAPRALALSSLSAATVGIALMIWTLPS